MKKLLFVEDDIVTGSVYRYHFNSAGYKVELAEDGEKALAALARFQPDVVVLDLLLPKLDGLEILKHIRSKPETEWIPVVVFTNAFASHLAIEAQKAGASKCLHKARTTASELLAVVDSATAMITATATVIKPQQPTSKAEEKPAPAPPKQEPFDPEKEFLKRTPEVLALMRRTAQELLNETDLDRRKSMLLDLEIKVHSLTSKAALAQAHSFAQMASALDVLLKELYEKPANASASASRTIGQSVDFLGVLFERGFGDVEDSSIPFKILIVDDEPIARKAVTIALARAQLKAESLEEPAEALTLLEKDAFDLVITDVNMPGISGFDLCQKLRALPRNSHTPVIFVTVHNEFSARLRSAASGGDDFIAKPFLSIELAVKALIHLLSGRPQKGSVHFQPFHSGA